MLRHYFTIAVRNLIRQKGYSLINILGLAIGMACCLVILLYVRDEFSYDRHNTKANRIYRIVTDRAARTPGPLAPLIQAHLPDVQKVLRLRGTLGTWLFATDRKRFYEHRVFWADETLFDIFDVELVQGNPATALNASQNIIISQSMARKYFGDADPIGQMITGDNFFHLTITGVMKDPPAYAHFHPDFYVSMVTLYDPTRQIGANIIEDWLESQFYTYLLLPSGESPGDLTRKLHALIEEHVNAETRDAIFSRQYTLQALTDIHLHSHLEFEMEPNGDVSFIWMLIAIAAFILLIACMNFMNLVTARSTTRTKEIGMRKVVGAQQRQLVFQFMGETIVSSLAAFCLALGIVVIVLPFFRSMTGYALSMPSLEPWSVIGGLGIILGVGVLAGSYPALVLSAFSPVSVFRGAARAGATGLRKVLVILQFSISIVLIIGAGVVYQQLAYIRSSPLGFEKEHVAVMPRISGMNGRMIFEQFPQQAGVVSVIEANYLPGREAGRGLLPVLPVRRPDMPEGQVLEAQKIGMWGDFATTLRLKLAAGRNLSMERDFRIIRGTDGRQVFRSNCLLNEEAVRRLDWTAPQDAVDQYITVANEKMQVVGVIRDFHLKSLHEKIEPVVIAFGGGGIFAIRLAAGDPVGTLRALQKLWEASTPQIPFEYSFLDEDVDRLYRADRMMGNLVTLFASLAVLTACLGLFGLSAFSIQQRTKEIGVRKVLGASLGHILVLLSKEFSLLVVVANLIAWPAAYLIMRRWLQNFAYHADMSLIWFPAAGVLALLIAWLTVSIQTIKAARANPVGSLRYE